jgi:hypothetical protein
MQIKGFYLLDLTLKYALFFKMITNKEYKIIRDWIVKNTCGCIYTNFTTEDLKREIKIEMEKLE